MIRVMSHRWQSARDESDGNQPVMRVIDVASGRRARQASDSLRRQSRQKGESSRLYRS